MLVKKTWITKKDEVEPGYTTIRCQVTRKWEGWYLFGIIPLYVRNFETIYR